MTQDAAEAGKWLGRVISGSLSQGVEVKLDSHISVEDMAVGRYITIEGKGKRFFGLITDVHLGALDPHLTTNPPDVSDPFIAEVIAGTGAYGVLKVMPALSLGSDAESLLNGPQPAKTVPAPFSLAREASQRDIELIFGPEDKDRFVIGNPLDMDAKLCLNLAEFVKRSNGVFGKSGTGKTFLTRLLLLGIIQKGVAVNLIFDMHSEYGWAGHSEVGYQVKALKQICGSRVAVFALDKENSLARGVSTDFVVQIGYDEIEPEDINMLRETLGLNELMVQAAYKLAKHFGQKHWLEGFLSSESQEKMGELSQKLGENEQTMRALQRRLLRLERLAFLVPQAVEDSVPRILNSLDRGISVVLEFGRYRDITAYMLVANILSRRIYDRYRYRVEKALAEGSSLPYPLVITIEEAHKFLSSELAGQTIFGTIAREMRKYNVTLLVVDQRPSDIDDEVMSQLGTKIVCLLDDPRDMDSVLSGKSELKGVLSRLASKQQALVFGHAVPMPVVVKTREYGSVQSYKEFGILDTVERDRQVEQDIKELF